MIELTTFLTEIAWPVTLLVAWLAGEIGHRWAKLPRISALAVVGVVFAPAQAAVLPAPHAVACRA